LELEEAHTMANETKIEAAAAVLEAMGGEAVVVEAPTTTEEKVAKVKKAVKAIKKAAAKGKPKKEEAPKRPGPKTVAVAFPANTHHQTADGKELEVVKVRVSYLVKVGGGRLQWFGSKKMDEVVKQAEGAVEETAKVAA
jgi:hypothetical protein